jgi:hypothetical protein
MHQVPEPDAAPVADEEAKKKQKKQAKKAKKAKKARELQARDVEQAADRTKASGVIELANANVNLADALRGATAAFHLWMQQNGGT